MTVSGAGVMPVTAGANLEAPGADRFPLDAFPADVMRPSRAHLVLLPGMLGDASLWDGVAANLLDIVSMSTSRIDLASSVTDLADLVLAEAPARFALAGHSLGGVVALEVVRRAPERVTRLALLNSSAREPADEQRASWTKLQVLVEQGGFAAVAEQLALANLPESKRHDRQLRDLVLRMAGMVGATGLLRQLAAQQSRVDALEWLSEVGIPTLIVSGELDTVSPTLLQREMAAAIPAAQHRELAGTGHLTPLENATQLSALMRTWLQS